MSWTAHGVPTRKGQAELDQLLSAPPGVALVFQHSTTPPIGGPRQGESALESGARAWVGPAVVRVIEDRPLSQAIAGRRGIADQWPQALLFQGGRMVWHAGHPGVTADALRHEQAAAGW